MYILTLFIAWLQMQGSNLVGNAWWDLFLDKMVGVETTFYHLSWWIWGAAIVMGLIFVLLGILNRSSELTASSLGCLVVFGAVLLLLPLFEYLSVVTVTGMAESFGPAGVINGGFYIALFIYAFITGLI